MDILIGKTEKKKYLDTKRGKMLEKYSLEYLTDRKFKEKLENANLEKEQIMKESRKESCKEKYKSINSKYPKNIWTFTFKS